MDEVFSDLIGSVMEVHVNDMVVKSSIATNHPTHLQVVFDKASLHNMRLNWEKCSFDVGGRKFLSLDNSTRDRGQPRPMCDYIQNEEPHQSQGNSKPEWQVGLTLLLPTTLGTKRKFTLQVAKSSSNIPLDWRIWCYVPVVKEGSHCTLVLNIPQ